MSRSVAFCRPDPAVLEDLRARIRRLENPFSARGEADGVLALGAPGMDGALPWGGLPRAALHEVLAVHRGAAAGFCAGLLARLAGDTGAVLWCRCGHDLYGPGLAALGLDPARLVVVRGRSAADVPWVMEEALRGGALAAVLGEADRLTATAARRLQLAAESGGAAALLLRPHRRETAAAPGPAVTRWRVAAAPSGGVGNRPGVGLPRWRVDLVKCRGGAAGAAPAAADDPPSLRSWLVEWRDGATAGHFAVVADLCHRPAAPAVAEGGGRAALRLAG